MRYLRPTGKGVNVQVHADGVSYDLYRKAGDGRASFRRMDMRFVGAEPGAAFVAHDQRSELLHFMGPGALRGVRQCDAVTVQGVYPGIDVELRITEDDGLKYNIVLRNSADLTKVRMRYAGYDEVRLHGDEVVFTVDGREFTERIPASWVGVDQRLVQVAYTIVEQADDHVVLGLRRADPIDSPRLVSLTVDPSVHFSWGTYLGGEGDDAVRAVDVADVGIIYATGRTAGVLSTITTGPYQGERMEPLLSPWAVGMGNGFRASVLHRARRAEGNVTFSTSAIVADGIIATKEERRDEGRRGFGWGAVVLDDRAGSPRMRSTDVAGALGYHVRFGAYSRLGGGVHLGLKQLRSGATDCQWASQYDGLSFDPSRPSGERFAERPVTVGDAAVGLCYCYERKGSGREGRSGIDLRAGLAGQHLNKPRLSLDREHGPRLARGWSSFCAGSFADARGKRRLEPLVLVSLQGREFIAQGGTAFAIALVEQNCFTGPDRVLSAGLGAYARTDGSGITPVHARWGEFGVMMSYELPLSAARRNALGHGAAEVGLFCELGQARR